jgi:hypothetical protein
VLVPVVLREGLCGVCVCVCVCARARMRPPAMPWQSEPPCCSTLSTYDTTYIQTPIAIHSVINTHCTHHHSFGGQHAVYAAAAAGEERGTYKSVADTSKRSPDVTTPARSGTKSVNVTVTTSSLSELTPDTK